MCRVRFRSLDEAADVREPRVAPAGASHLDRRRARLEANEARSGVRHFGNQFWEEESRRDRKCGVSVRLRALRLNRQKLPEKPLTP